MSLLRRRILQQPFSPRIFLRIFSNQSFSTANPLPPIQRRTTDFDELINKAGTSGDFETVRSLLNTRRESYSCFATKNTFKFLTNTSSSYSSDLENLRRVLPQIDAGFTQRNAYEILIARLCKLNRIDDALILIGDIKFGLTSSTFHPILCSLTKRNRFEEAWRVVESMRSKSVSIDVTSYNYFLNSYCYNGDLEEVSKVLKKIEEEEIPMDAYSYDALVIGICRLGKVEAAILRRMEEEGVVVLYSTYAHVVTEMVKCGYYMVGFEFVMAYAGKDLKLDCANFGVLVGKLLKRKRVEEAKIVLEEMVKRGLSMSGGLREFYERNVRIDDKCNAITSEA